MEREREAGVREGSRGADSAGPQRRPEAPFAVVLLAAARSERPWPDGAPAPDREAWRKVEAGRVTVVGTASDAQLVETAVTIRRARRSPAGPRPGGVRPAAAARRRRRPRRGSTSRGSGSRRPRPRPADGSSSRRRATRRRAAGLLRSATVALARRSKAPLPAWLVTGLAEYFSTFSATGARATLGRLVPEHVALLRAARLPTGSASSRRRSLDGDDAASVLLRAEAWAVVHVLLQGTPDGEERLGRFVALLAEGRDGDRRVPRCLRRDASRRSSSGPAAHVVESRPLARFVPVPQPRRRPGRLLPLTRAGAAGVLGGVARGRRAPVPGRSSPRTGRPSAPPVPGAAPRAAAVRPSADVSRDVPAEVDLVNRLIDEGREEEALARLEALHASLGKDPEMQRALGWDVQEVTARRRPQPARPPVQRGDRPPQRGPARRGDPGLPRGRGLGGRPRPEAARLGARDGAGRPQPVKAAGVRDERRGDGDRAGNLGGGPRPLKPRRWEASCPVASTGSSRSRRR